MSEQIVQSDAANGSQFAKHTFANNAEGHKSGTFNCKNVKDTRYFTHESAVCFRSLYERGDGTALLAGRHQRGQRHLRGLPTTFIPQHCFQRSANKHYILHIRLQKFLYFETGVKIWVSITFLLLLFNCTERPNS